MKLPEKYQFLDYGTDLYAPQSTLDEEWQKNPDSMASYAGTGRWKMAGNDVYSACCGSAERSHLFPRSSECTGSIYKGNL